MSAESSRIRVRRQGVLAEISAVGMELLAEGKQVTLTSVSRRMGLTTPALYHYVRDSSDLVNVVADAIVESIIDFITERIDAFNCQDPLDRVTVATVAFRYWALHHVAEFRHTFLPSPEHIHTATGNTRAGRIADFIAAQLLGPDKTAVDIREIGLTPEWMPADLIDQIAAFGHTGDAGAHNLAAAAPTNFLASMRVWAGLFGFVTLEVFQQFRLDREVLDKLFIYFMSATAHQFGLPTGADHMTALLRRVGDFISE